MTGKGHYVLLVGMGLVLMLTGAVARAQQAQQPQASPAQESQTQQAPGEAETLHVLVGQSLSVSSPARIKRISVATPGIIDAVVENPNQVQINGKAPGDVSLVVWDETGQSQEFYVYVDRDDRSLADQLPEALPDKPVQVEVQKKKIAWLGWVVIASIALLAGAMLRARRKREPYLNKIDLQLSKVGSPDGYNEPVLAATHNARAEARPVEEAITGGVTKQGEDLEKIAQELGERWSRQFQEQAEAAVESLREELKDLRRVVEESKQQLAGLVEGKLASLIQATRDDYDRQLAQAFREQAQVMHEAAEGEVRSIKQAAEDAIAQLQAAEQKRETSFLARAGAADERLTGVSLAVEALQGRVGALVEDFQGKQVKQAEDLQRIAQEFEGRWSQQFQEQAEAAEERLREELKNSEGVVEESKQQLASLAEANLATLSQVAASATAGLEVEQTRLKNQYETSRRQFEALIAKGWAKLPPASFGRGNPPRRRGSLAQLALVAGASLVTTASLLGVYLWTAPVIELQSEAPAEFVDQSPNWSAKRRAREEEVAQAYWQVAVDSLQERYPFGSELPADPPTEFQVDNKYAPTGGAKAVSETRAHYWEKLRRSWVQHQSWVERYEGNTRWATRLWQIWDQLNLSK